MFAAIQIPRFDANIPASTARRNIPPFRHPLRMPKLDQDDIDQIAAGIDVDAIYAEVHAITSKIGQINKITRIFRLIKKVLAKSFAKHQIS